MALTLNHSLRLRDTPKRRECRDALKEALDDLSRGLPVSTRDEMLQVILQKWQKLRDQLWPRTRIIEMRRDASHVFPLPRFGRTAINRAAAQLVPAVAGGGGVIQAWFHVRRAKTLPFMGPGRRVCAIRRARLLGVQPQQIHDRDRSPVLL